MRRLALVAMVSWSLSAGAVPSGRKWFFPDCSVTACPSTMQCVSNRCSPLVHLAASVDNSGSMTLNGGLAYSTFLARAPEAFRNWTAARVTTCSTSYDVQVGATFSSPSGITAMSAKDGTNAVIWLSGTAWRYSAATLGLTTTSYYVATNEIFDADMELNNNAQWASDGRTTAYDMESVVLHEAGHFLGLDHSPASGIAVMFPDVSPGGQKRALASPDTADVCSVYPGAAGSLGTTCKVKADCNGALVCEGAPGATQLTCVQDCSAVTDNCPTAYTCRGSTSGFACLPQIGVPDQCKFCTNGQDCSTGLCLYDSTTFSTYCSLTCADTSQCGPGYTCTSTASGSYCVPTSPCTKQCTTPDQCAIDYLCTGGTCLPKGEVGNRCEILGYCKSCGACVGTGTGEAFCRTCCGSGGTSTQCGACTNTATACTGGLVCTSLVSTDSACIAGSAAPGECQACNNGQCADGYSCFNGLCHSSCNPNSPGSCAVCLPLETGGGACACSTEVADDGQPCGNVAGSVKGCRSGLACVGGPVGTTQKICRALCDITQPTSCASGYMCQLSQGLAVCLPGSAGNVCANCTNAGTCNTGLSCYLGRCYASCNINVANTCSTCIQTDSNGVGICGCSDQISVANGPCGNQPEVHACGPGLQCLNGLCREQCNPTSPLNCPVNTSCTALGTAYYCQDQVSSGGGGGGAGGGSGGGGGTTRTGGGSPTGGGGGKVTSQPCGCSSPPMLSPLLFGLLTLLRRRRRS